MNISMEKKYTLDGNQFTVLTVTKPGIFSVLGYSLRGTPHEFQADGRNAFCRLVEFSPYADFVIDEKVMVRDNGSKRWTRAHFAKVGEDQKPRTWDYSTTRWTAEGSTPWDECRRPTAEELAT